MNHSAILREIKTLPPDLRKQVSDFVAFLKQKNQSAKATVTQREFGYAKGKVHIKEDFDASVDGFEEYSTSLSAIK
ncbi:type II toxin-antitoxin system VapB family antitoxin [Telluribacter sp.]|jgi:mRNA-degrading endonuclease RelE of RelBE toxin-antitoxin system|uniref:type II toxin-antitoxin system VapB family antitoxin n=1 Tax=Telluribacter sp. TaxID=1978767 RepID=UPI002E0FA8A4|nr:DUF2281 domain-containing protein [Telluribacter sp.]